MKIPNKFLVLLLCATVFLGSFTVLLSSMNPGFEGAKCNFYGVTFQNKLHPYHLAEDPIATGTGFFNLAGDTTLYWSGFATPNDAGLGCKAVHTVLGITSTHEHPTMKVHVENNVQLQDITRQGDPDPLNWNENNPLEGRTIEYWSKKAVKTVETEDTVTYEYELTKESFLIVPAEFWVGFYLVPSQDSSGTASGWREGEYFGMTAWFRLDFHVWDNAYYDDWMDDPEAEVYTTEYGGTIISQKKMVDPEGYRGGFPIAGWIQAWEKAGWTSAGGESESPVWYDVRGTETGTYTQEQLWDLKDILMSKTEFSPDMVGTMLSLYSDPSTSFDYTKPDYTDFENTDSLTDAVKTPDSTMKKVMYFPINVDNFGTYAQEQGWWGLTGWKVYYPSAYFRIRMIYGVYGTFKYLWTEEVTKPVEEGGLDYPSTFERHGTTVIATRGPLSPFADVWGGLGDWFGSPFGLIWTIFIIMVIIIIVVTVMNPRLWTNLSEIYSKGGKKGFKK